MQGSGAIDLYEGHVWPPGIMDYDPPEELNEDSDSFDPDRWLFFRPESDGGYRDMLDFASTVENERLRERMFRALDGRGAFRRFRDVLEEAPDAYRSRWSSSATNARFPGRENGSLAKATAPAGALDRHPLWAYSVRRHI